MTKRCNQCQHTWTVTVYLCPRCGSSDIGYAEETQLPIGYKAPEYKTIDSDLKQWYKNAIEAIKKMPKDQ